MHISFEQLQALSQLKTYEAMIDQQLAPTQQRGLAGQTPVKQIPTHKPENPDKLLLLLEEDE